MSYVMITVTVIDMDYSRFLIHVSASHLFVLSCYWHIMNSPPLVSKELLFLRGEMAKRRYLLSNVAKPIFVSATSHASAIIQIKCGHESMTLIKL